IKIANGAAGQPVMGDFSVARGAFVCLGKAKRIVNAYLD
ncbi:hypothetical protein CYY_007426, partial [Polysphondylium violaceum]